jgi:hypothetical protein
MKLVKKQELQKQFQSRKITDHWIHYIHYIHGNYLKGYEIPDSTMYFIAFSHTAFVKKSNKLSGFKTGNHTFHENIICSTSILNRRMHGFSSSLYPHYKISKF